jgi:hypothetical protein
LIVLPGAPAFGLGFSAGGMAFEMSGGPRFCLEAWSFWTFFSSAINF